MYGAVKYYLIGPKERKETIMKRLMVIVLTLALLMSIGGNAFAGEAVRAVFADTTGGKVQGYRYDGIDNYLGIQYGTAERFQAPEPYSWENVRVCNVEGEVAPQNTIDTATRDLFNCFPNKLLQVQSEKLCLQLNVWTPETGSEPSRPVVVWIHGGGWSTGSSTQFNMYLGESLAKKEDVVFVSVNHRLNCLGYLDVSAYGGDEYKYSGNAGVLDLVLALEWVRDNIATFGGDPGNVTIVGQSGGGAKVMTLMSMPSARGLFHKAVNLSGGFDATSRTTESAQADTAKVVEQLGLSGSTNEEIMTALLGMSYEELYAACSAANVPYASVIDGDLLPNGEYEVAGIPVMCSNVLGEFSTNYANVPYSFTEENYNALNFENQTEESVLGSCIAKWGDEYGPKILEAFKEAYPTHNVAEVTYLNDRRLVGSVNTLPMAQRITEAGGTVYNCVAAYTYPMYGGIVAIHTASDVPFWFANVDDMKEFVAGDEEGAQAVNDAMSAALGAFARNGDPSTESLPWEAYTPDTGATMVFDVQSELKYDHDKELFELIEAAPQLQAGFSPF